MENPVSRDCRDLFDLMRRFWGGFGRQTERVLVENRINVPQYLAMVALSKSGVSTMGKLAKGLFVTMGAATNIVDRLIRGGYVERERGTDDRRIVRVKLLPKGEQTLKAVEEAATAFMTSVLREMDDARRRQFLDIFSQMVNVSESGN